MLKDIAKISVHAILKQKLRATLTILAMSIGISAVILVFSAGHGLRVFINGELDVFGADAIEIEVKVPNVGKTSSENAQGLAQGITITTLKERDIIEIRKHPNIEYIYGAVMAQEAVGYSNIIKKIMLMGTGFEAPLVNNYDIYKGRYFSEDEEKASEQVAVLGYKTSQDLFGDDNPIGKNIKIGGKKFQVIGVMQEIGSALIFDMDRIIYIPVTTLQKRLLGTDYLSFAVAKMRDTTIAKQTQEELTEIMRTQHEITDPNKDDFAVNTMDEAEDMLGSIIDSITVLLVALVCISLIVGGVGIMNIMYVSVAERTFEIGLRKSLGAKQKDILIQFLLEAVFITLGGGIAGVIIGAILAYILYVVALACNFSWSYSVSLQSIFIAVSFSIMVGLLFGIYPAKKASALNPIEALRKQQ
ncbi:MAG: ABC transporter permease [Candidatus Magasanikbacteria bacterium]